jgi:hypothetical protein
MNVFHLDSRLRRCGPGKIRIPRNLHGDFHIVGRAAANPQVCRKRSVRSKLAFTSVGFAGRFPSAAHNDFVFIAADDVNLSRADVHFELPAGGKVRFDGMMREIVDSPYRYARKPEPATARSKRRSATALRIGTPHQS